MSNQQASYTALQESQHTQFIDEQTPQVDWWFQ